MFTPKTNKVNWTDFWLGIIIVAVVLVFMALAGFGIYAMVWGQKLCS